MEPDDLEIEHDREAEELHAWLDGEKAYLDYRRTGEGEVDFRATFVPEAHRNRGIATAVVEHALSWAEEEGLEVIPSCPSSPATSPGMRSTPGSPPEGDRRSPPVREQGLSSARMARRRVVGL